MKIHYPQMILEILAELKDDEDCSFDHNGHCQAHTYFESGRCVQQRLKEILQTGEAQNFYIWNSERNMWWKPNGFGYTKNRYMAGIYSYEEAMQICQDANQTMEDQPEDMMVPVKETR